MSKKPDLRQALQRASGSDVPVNDPAAAAPSAPETPSTRFLNRSPSRVGKHQIAGYFDREAHIQFKTLAVEQERSQQSLLAEALDLLFHKYGKPQIARKAGDALND